MQTERPSILTPDLVARTHGATGRKFASRELTLYGSAPRELETHRNGSLAILMTSALSVSTSSSLIALPFLRLFPIWVVHAASGFAIKCARGLLPKVCMCDFPALLTGTVQGTPAGTPARYSEPTLTRQAAHRSGGSEYLLSLYMKCNRAASPTLYAIFIAQLTETSARDHANTQRTSRNHKFDHSI